jgi:hypothetical protein
MPPVRLHRANGRCREAGVETLNEHRTSLVSHETILVHHRVAGRLCLLSTRGNWGTYSAPDRMAVGTARANHLAVD